MFTIKKTLLLISCTSLFLSACEIKDEAISFESAPKYEINHNFEGELNQKVTSNQSVTNDSGTVSQDRKTVYVKRVVDGDTIVYVDPSTGTEITGRFLGINSPESTKEQQLYGKDAAMFLSNLIEGKEIQIESDPNADVTDKYGRYLIHGFIGGKSIQYLLLQEGLTRVAYLYGDYNYIELYKEAEGIAKEKGLNIHSIPGYLNDSNGFNMDNVSSSIKSKVFDLTKQIIKN